MGLIIHEYKYTAFQVGFMYIRVNNGLKSFTKLKGGTAAWVEEGTV